MSLQEWINVLGEGERNYLLSEDRMQLRDWLIELQQYRGETEEKYIFTFWDSGSYMGKTIIAKSTKEAIHKFKKIFPRASNICVNGTTI